MRLFVCLRSTKINLKDVQRGGRKKEEWSGEKEEKQEEEEEKEAGFNVLSTAAAGLPREEKEKEEKEKN